MEQIERRQDTERLTAKGRRELRAMAERIREVFVWEATREGHAYWSGVQDALRRLANRRYGK